jgi:hypothetical protein
MIFTDVLSILAYCSSFNDGGKTYSPATIVTSSTTGLYRRTLSSSSAALELSIATGSFCIGSDSVGVSAYFFSNSA